MKTKKILLLIVILSFLVNNIKSQELWKKNHSNFPDKSFIKKNKIYKIQSVLISSIDTKK